MKTILTKLGERTELALFLRKAVELNFRQEKKYIRRFLALAPGERVLDVGCGTGEFAVSFTSAQYDGIDIDPSNIAYARRRYPSHMFEISDALRIPRKDRSFDAVLVVGVLHHLSTKEARQALLEIRRVLKPRGKVLIMEDTVSQRPITRLMHHLDQGAHIRTKQEWHEILSDQFSIDHSWTFNSGVCFYSGFILTPRSANP